MKTVILAAGMGSRLKSLTQDRPKTMLEINERMLINYIVSVLLKNQITDITVVVGYQYEKIIKYLEESFPEAKLKFIVNTEYRSKENIYSLYLAIPYIKNNDLLIINSDIFCDAKIIKMAIDTCSNSMIVDADVEYTLEGTKVKINETGYISEIGKDLSQDKSDGEYIGILKLGKDSADIYLEQIQKMIATGNDHVWYPYALRMILHELKIKPIFTDGLLWEEIDTPQDYKSAIRKSMLMKDPNI